MARRRGAPIPPARLRFMGGSDDEFLEQADTLAATVHRLGVRDDAAVLDVGCGYGRLAIGLGRAGFKGKYLGFDILAPHVAWAGDTITRWRRRFRFVHVDVRNDRYNAKGEIDPADFRFPVPDRSVDAAVLFSVFTHFYTHDIERYLRELRRVVRPNGVVIATYLLFDDMTLEAARTTSSYPMVHQLDDDCIYSDAEDPLRAIAYRQSTVLEQIERVGFVITAVERGRWNGGSGPDFQDVVTFRPAVAWPQRSLYTVTTGVKRRLGAARRRVRAVL